MRVVHLMREPYTVQVSRPAPLGNPFAFKPSKFPVVTVSSRSDAIDWWERYARNDKEAVERVLALGANKYRGQVWLVTPEEMRTLIEGLSEDAILGCWCAPLSCHADRIVKLWKEWRK